MADTGLSGGYKVISRINRVCATVSSAILLFITLAIFVDVILRYFFGRPSIWVTEVSTYLFLYIIFLGTAYALEQGQHIKVTFVVDLLSQRARQILALITSIMAMIFCLVLLWQSTVMTYTGFKEHWTSPTMLNAPYAYVHVVMVVGSFFLFVTFVLKTILVFKAGGPPKGD